GCVFLNFCYRYLPYLRQPCPFVQIFDLGIKGYTAAQRARLKMIKPTFCSHAGKLRCEVGAYCV
ncbi:MAG: hypothetical protein D8B42_04815, partial [Kingella sp. (in: b-proteobacteria)]